MTGSVQVEANLQKQLNDHFQVLSSNDGQGNGVKNLQNGVIR